MGENGKLLSLLLVAAFLISVARAIPLACSGAVGSSYSLVDPACLNVYVLSLADVGNRVASNHSMLIEGVLEACKNKQMSVQLDEVPLNPLVREPVYMKINLSITVHVINDWAAYKSLIESESNVIVINTHDEILPVPNGSTRDEWIAKIADFLMNRWGTWVHVGGYPFYYVHYQNGVEEEWGDAGFKTFMSHIGKGNVDVWPPTDENALASFAGYARHAMLYLHYKGTSIASFNYATLGRPLKVEDFEEYIVMPIYDYSYGGKGYWTGAAIAFVNASDRYTNKYGCGVYVHLGTRYLYAAGGQQLDADYGRGFIGTAVALWIETTAFKPSYNVVSEYSGMFNYNRTCAIEVYPTVIGVSYNMPTETYYVSVSFAFHAILKAKQEDNVFTFYTGTANAGFYLGDFPSQWSDVRVRADLGDTDLSKQGKRGTAITLSGMYSDDQLDVGLIVKSLLFAASAFEGIGEVVAAIDGILLFAEWTGLFNNPSYPQKGVNQFDTYVQFFYDPIIDYQIKDGFRYEQISSIITVEIKIPKNQRSGWNILSFAYTIGVGTQNHEAEPYVEGTLELAIWFPGAGQNDAQSGGDAGNSHAAATPVTAFVTHYGYLGGNDGADWYKLNVQAGETITVSMGPPAYVNFDLELYSPSNPNNPKIGSHSAAGIMETLSYTADSSGYWRIRIYKVSGSGNYWFTLTLGGGGGCPYIYVWNGSAYVLDNNVLGLSEVSGGSDVEDYYKLEQPMAPAYAGNYFSTYKVMLGEFESELSYIDKVKLIAIDHDPNINIALTPDNQILTYTSPNPPISAIDNYGYDWLPWLVQPDNHYYRGVMGDWLLIDFGDVNVSQAAKLVLRANLEWKKDTCIHVQVLNETGQWVNAAVLRTRYHWSTIIVDLNQYLPNTVISLKIRLYFTGIHKIDYIGLDTTPQQNIQAHSAPPVLAINSKNSVITFKLLLNDQKYAQLLPGEQIQIYFSLPNQPNNKQRTYIIYIEGHYQTT